MTILKEKNLLEAEKDGAVMKVHLPVEFSLSYDGRVLLLLSLCVGAGGGNAICWVSPDRKLSYCVECIHDFL